MPVHSFPTVKSNASDTSIVSANYWNDTHVYAVTPLSANTTLNVAHDLVLATAGAGGITLTLPTAIGNKGRTFVIKRVDSAAGNVSIATTLSQTIDGDSGGWVLHNIWQYVNIVSDGANWVVIANN